METVKLAVQSRDLASSVKALRQSNIIPAVYYGQKESATHVQVDYQTFRKVYMKAGYSQLVDLSVDGNLVKKVLIHDIQSNPLTGKIEHIDFLLVSMTEKITADVPIKFIGESPAVKNLGGVLNTVKDEITVKCLPTDIPPSFEVDISVLEEISTAIHVSDLVVPHGVEIVDVPEDVVVIINAPRAEEEAAPAAAAVEGEEGVAKEGEVKEGETAEGAGKEEKSV